MSQELKNALRYLEIQDNTNPSQVTHTEQAQPVQQFMTGQDNIILPVKGGRSSEPENSSAGLLSKNMVLMPDFSIEFLKMMEYLGVFNRHVSQAIENIVTLSNTEFDIEFADNVKTSEQKKMQEYLKNKMNSYYEFSDGISSLGNDMFTQIAINGALSFEAIPDKSLSGIRKVAMISPKNVRFIYDDKNDAHHPFQIVTGLATKQNQKTFNGMIPLNQATYSYMAFRRYTTSPYGCPPFLSAIEDLVTQYDMVGSFKNMMKRMGVLGFLSVLVKAPVKKNGEDDTIYYNRLSAYLDSIEPQVAKQATNGVAIGFKDTHEFNIAGNNMNAAGAEKLMTIIKSLIYSGIKQDPNMHGENWSVTEAFAKVILAKMTTQMGNYQRLVATGFEKIFILDLVLGGFSPGLVNVTFKKPMINDLLKEVQAEAIKITNTEKKYNMGIISQQQVANELGYEKPDQEEPRVLSGVPASEVADPKADPEKDEKETDEKDVEEAVRALRGTGEFDYHIPEGCDSLNFEFNDPKANRFSKKYNGKISGIYKKAIKDLSSSILNRLKSANFNSLENFRNTVLVEIATKWPSYFQEPIRPIVIETTQDMYNDFRKDKTPFKEAKKKKKDSGYDKESFLQDVPDATLNLIDYRSIDFFNRSDNYYLGKFIVDRDTQDRVKAFIEDWYVLNQEDIGQNDRLLEQFAKEFEGVLNLESWKIRRIIDTTVSRIRNYAHVNYLSQAKIEAYEIVEVMDQKTCGWCKEMDGKSFSVTANQKMIEDIIGSDPENVKSVSPFATSIKLDDFKGITEQELQKKGITLPAFHCHCRGRIVAVV